MRSEGVKKAWGWNTRWREAMRMWHRQDVCDEGEWLKVTIN